jgi:hypothetical protein
MLRQANTQRRIRYVMLPWRGDNCGELWSSPALPIYLIDLA